MARVIISNLVVIREENLLTELESWEMRSIQGGNTVEEGTVENGTRRRRRRRRSSLTIDSTNLSATLDDISVILADIAGQLDESLQSLG
ncbi:MAG: hypothetical protein KME21_15270 [Desmonostoc vinosum HA7617-LM4]|jgi:hypothetical protein|nr:hypothetical protein [Desmonostoc vinosum HA7617-LM4]